MDLMAEPAAGPETGGGPKGMEELVATWHENLLRFALALTKSEADAWDLTQQTFAIFAAKGHQLREPRKVKSWLFTTLHRLFLETCRKQTRFPHRELDELDPELPSVPPAELEHLDSAQALRALEWLDEMFRAPVRLFYLEEQPYKAIAQRLEVPIGTVKSRISRGLVQLRNLLDNPAWRPAETPQWSKGPERVWLAEKAA